MTESNKEPPKEAPAEGELTDEELEHASGGTSSQYMNLQTTMQRQSQQAKLMSNVQKAHNEAASDIINKLR